MTTHIFPTVVSTPSKPEATDIRQAIVHHLRDLEKQAIRESKRKRHFRQWFETLHVVIGLPAAVLAGAATVTALKDFAPDVIALLAGGATVLSAAQLFLRAADRAAFNRTLEGEFGRLAADARTLREIELPSLDDGAATKIVKEHEHTFATLQQRKPLAD